MGEKFLLVGCMGRNQGQVHGKPKQDMRTLRRASEDMPSQNMANQGEYKRPVYYAMLG